MGKKLYSKECKRAAIVQGHAITSVARCLWISYVALRNFRSNLLSINPIRFACARRPLVGSAYAFAQNDNTRLIFLLMKTWYILLA